LVTRNRYLSAVEAAKSLGISLPTLYAYVSRGLIRSEAAGAGRRNRRYHRDDVERLRTRREQRRNPARAAEQALHWGLPVLDSALSLITAGRLYYRGHDALALAADCSFEQAAQLLWLGTLPQDGEGCQPQDAGPPAAAQLDMGKGADVNQGRRLPAEFVSIEAFQSALLRAAPLDPAAYDLRPAAVAQTGARILRRLTEAAVHPDVPMGRSIAESLQLHWAGKRPRTPMARLLDAALILCADHELNVSAFTARCVASAGATPYAVVVAGLAALQGTRHGGHTARVEALLDEIGTPSQAGRVVSDRLKRGDPVPGFGHPLYPDGDPRGRALLAMTTTALPRSRHVTLGRAVAVEARRHMGEHPTLDFGLVVLARSLGLPRGGGLALFVLGRTAGWIGHAIEQYQSEEIIRPRARYVGVMPRLS
jgi:citrate synthase